MVKVHYLEHFVELCVHGKGDTDRHLLTLFAVALACKGKSYIELGVKNGRTTLPILMAAYLNAGKLVSVDKEDTPFRPPESLASHWQFVKSDALTFLSEWEQVIDFIFIDDRHCYGHVRLELAFISEWVTPASVILLHDLMYFGHEPFYHSDRSLPEDHQWGAGGPYRAVAELDRSIWEWATLPWSHGLTLLRRK